MKIKFTVTLAALLSLLVLVWFAPLQADQEPGKDHPLLSRMKGYIITDYSQAFDAHEFQVSAEKAEQIEGQKTFIAYTAAEGTKPASMYQITKNYINAVKSLGGEVLSGGQTGDHGATMKVVKNGKEIYILVEVYNEGYNYSLVLLEKGEMTQEVGTGDLAAALNKDGHVALYINFDTGKADIKPDSLPIIEKIVTLLKADPGLKLIVEGHTDNTGDPEGNKRLSNSRASAVVAMLIVKGITPDRLKAVGLGREKPIADNSTEQGRAKNRRVELVKR